MLTTSPNLRAYAEAKLETVLADDAQFLGRLRPDGAIWGVVAFERFTEHNCEMHMAGESGFVSRPFIRAAFHYPFIQLGKARVTGLVDEKNEAALSIDKRLGFKEEGRLRNALGDRDIIVLGMLKHECRWVHYGR